MEVTIVIFVLAIMLMLLSFFLFPSISIGHRDFGTYWMITLLFAAVILMVDREYATRILAIFASDDSTNPLKIITLFISITFISKFLDSAGLFDFLATRAAKIGHGNQFVIFTLLYFLFSLITMLTNNDVIIITTPIVIYFAKASNANPIPYLIMECFALNTLSSTFLTSNVSNLYLGSFFGITYLDYLVRLTPVALILMVLLYVALLASFWPALRKPIDDKVELAPIKDRFLLALGLSVLAICTLFLVVGNYIHLEMYLITLGFALLDLVVGSIYVLAKKKDREYILKPLKGLPYEFIPFLSSMFVLVSALQEVGVLREVGKALASLPLASQPWVYGFSSMIAANLVNNVPMSLLFADIINAGGAGLTSVYAAILSSNLCALITPAGALSTLMFMRIVKENDVRLSYGGFMKYAYVGILLEAAGIGLLLVL